MSTVGFVGLGDMGSRMVPHLLGANHRVVVFDVIRGRLDAVTALGAVAAGSPAAAARDADVVISAVMSADVPTAHLGPEGILAGMRHGAALAVVARRSCPLCGWTVRLDCAACAVQHHWTEAARPPIPEARAACPGCGNVANVIATDQVAADAPWADYPLD